MKSTALNQITTLLTLLGSVSAFAEGEATRTPSTEELRESLGRQIASADQAPAGGSEGSGVSPTLSQVFSQLNETPTNTDGVAVDPVGRVAEDNDEPESTRLRRTRLSDGTANRFMVGDSELAPRAGQPSPLIGAHAPQRQPEVFPWQSKQFQDCGLSCLHDRAGEITSLSVVYSLEKIRTIEAAYQRDQDSGRQAARANLQTFCHQPSGAAIDQCFMRYKQLTKLNLLRQRRAILENQRLADLYRGTDPNVQVHTGIEVEANADPRADGRPVTMSLPTFEELQQYHDASKRRLSRLNSVEYADWVRRLPTEPSMDDFIIYERRRSNPADPTSDMITALATTCQIDECQCQNGICRDMAKYNQAMAQFRLAKQQMEADFEQRAENPIDPSKALPQRMNGTTIGQESMESYQKARAHMVQAANRQLVRHGVQPAANQLTFNGSAGSAGPSRQVAQTRSPQAPTPQQPADAANPQTRADEQQLTAAQGLGATQVYDQNGEELRVMQAPAGQELPQLSLSVDPEEVGQLAEQIEIYRTHRPRPASQSGAGSPATTPAGGSSAQTQAGSGMSTAPTP